MVWQQLLLAAFVIPLTFAAGDAAKCSNAEYVAGVCTDVNGTINDDTAVLTGSESDDGDADGSEGDPGANGAEGPNGGRDDWEITEPVTLRDIAEFRPTPGIERMEPDGWVVAGLPANIYAIVGMQLVPGELLGRPATVRFTPVAYHWSYGDGTSATRATKGATWAKLGLHEFDATPTSHIYLREGEYTIRLVIDFRAEYRYGSDEFIPIAGVIDLRANDLHITVAGAKTVLVDRDCTLAPAGPGC